MLYTQVRWLSTQRACEEPQRVGKGMWLAEGLLWTPWTHLGTATAESQLCELLLLDAKDFQDILVKFPSTHAMMYALAFVDALNSEALTSDLPICERKLDKMIGKAFPVEDEDSESSEDSD